MATRYAVLYGERGIKKSKTKSRAIAVGKKILAKGRYKQVEIDKITTYPRARVGETDWSQRTIKVLKKRK